MSGLEVDVSGMNSPVASMNLFSITKHKGRIRPFGGMLLFCLVLLDKQ